MPGDERLNVLKQAESQGKLRKKQEADESKRNQEQADRRIRELELVAKNHDQEGQKVLLKSTHYMSLGFMYLVSVLTKGIWLVILGVMQAVTGVIWLFSSVIGGIVGGEVGDASKAILYLSSWIGAMITISIIILSITQIIDVFRARNAFRSGSDPGKTSD